MLLNEPWLMRPTTWAKELSPAIWLRGDGTLHTDGAANFVAASSQYLSIVSNSTLQAGSSDFWVAGWANLATKPTQAGFIGKWNSGANKREYEIDFLASSDRFRFAVSSDGISATVVNANALGSPSTGTWYFILCWYDNAGQTISIKINNGTTNSTAFASTINNSDSTVCIGSVETGGSYLDGKLDSVIVGKAPPGGIAGVISTINSTLYNSGNGLSAKDITTTQRTAWGVISGLDFDSTTNLTKDYIGTNTLTNNNTVTFVAGQVTGNTLADGDVVTTWDDGSGNTNNALQATASARPIYKTAIQNNKSVIRFDGIDDNVTTTSALMSMSYLTNCTIFMVIVPNASQTNNTNNIFVSSSSVVPGNFQLNAYLGLGTPQLLSNDYPTKWCSGFSKDQNSTQENHTSVAFGSTTKIYSLILTGGVFTNYLNGTQDGQATANATMQGATTNSQTWRIGVGAMKGDIAEFLVWNAVLSSSQKTQVETYLNWKYRVY